MSSPVVSIIVATYNVAAYLPEFLASLDRQAGTRQASSRQASSFEAVFVNDGSTDASGQILADWGRQSSCRHRVITTDNRGVAIARNTGIEAATGDWLTFCDPDDVLGKNYLATMVTLLRPDRAGALAIAVGNTIYLDHATGRLSNTHPLRFRFRDSDRIIDLDNSPTFIHLATNTGFYRRTVIEEHHIRFDPRIKPVFEDAHFTGSYLATFDRPQIAYSRSAVYEYRRGRIDGSSLMQGAWTDEGKLTNVPEYGWLDLLRQIHAQRGHVPAWAQNMVIYDLFWYLKQDRRSPSPIAGFSAAAKVHLHRSLAEIAPYLDRENIEDFRINRVPSELRIALAIGLKGPLTGTPVVTLDRIDSDQGLVRFTYYFTGDSPSEAIRAGGLVIRPVHAKIRVHRFADRVMMLERTGWLPAVDELSISLDGRPAELTLGPIGGRRFSVTATRMWSELLPEDGRDLLRRAVIRARLPTSAERRSTPRGLRRSLCRDVNNARDAIRSAYRKRRLRLRRLRALFRVDRTRFIARSPINRRFKNAWLLIDRDLQAQDNAEHLYRYLREHQRSVNAWFVLDPASPDWTRLERAGFRLIVHGSWEHKMALLNAQHLISSQIDEYITNPPNIRRLRPRIRPGWQFTFLQHGVTKDDLSNWINSKPISLMITASPQEQAAIVADHTAYRWTTKEVRLTGFPRHDRLLSLSRQQEATTRAIVVMPTWRRALLDFTVGAGSVHPLRADFWDTDFAKAWQAFLSSDALAEVARHTGWRITFLPHPLIQSCLDTSPLPDHVETRRFDEVDIQAVIAAAAVLVTDYSSNAFEAAYLHRPVVYFQFDQDEFFGGTHSYTRGTWSYQDDGFGPVVPEVGDAVREVLAAIDRDGTPDPLYAERMSASFPFRDGRCSERTFEAIRDLKRPLTMDELYRRVDDRHNRGKVDNG